MGGRRAMSRTPQGSKNPAQGNALGTRGHQPCHALKGHKKPFGCGTLFPRALPWAGFLQPFRLKLLPGFHGWPPGDVPDPAGVKESSPGQRPGNSWPPTMLHPERAQETAVWPGLVNPHSRRPQVSSHPWETFGQMKRQGRETRAEREGERFDGERFNVKPENALRLIGLRCLLESIQFQANRSWANEASLLLWVSV